MSDTAIAAPVPADKKAGAARVPKIVFATLGLITVALALGLVLVFTMLNGEIAAKGSEVAALKSDLARNDEKLTALRTAVDENAKTLQASGAQQVAALQSKLAAANARITQLSNCLPELQTELNGMSVNTSDQGGWLTGAYITNPVQVSRFCEKTLYGANIPRGQ